MLSTNHLVLRVESKSVAAHEIVSLRLVDAREAPLPAFKAGAHIDVHVGVGMVRQYSLCNPSARPAYYEIAVLREPNSRGGSKFLHEELVAGAELQTSLPKNHFELVDDVPVLLFAGGIGITPILAMTQQLSSQGRSFELHYCSRSSTRAAFKARLEGASCANNVHFYFDDGEISQRLDIGAVLARATPEHHLYVCGPGGFIQHVIDAATRAGWVGDRLHREFFSAPPVAASEVVDGAFEIELASSGRRLVIPIEKSALTVLQEAGIAVPASCETGVCGTCLTRVIEGVPDHRDVYLSDAERGRNDCFTPCCSRAFSKRLVIDL